MKEKVLILYSGGADSRLMLELAYMFEMEPFCLLIDYNQLHKEELTFAKTQLEELQVPMTNVSLSGLCLDSALTGDGEKGRFQGVSEWHVPGRNTLFAGIALSVAENLGCSVVWNGADFSDRLNKFIDCYQDYVVAVNDVYKLGASYAIRYETPLAGMTKDMVMGLLKFRGIDRTEIFSGYGELEHQCQKGDHCGSCGI